MFAAGPPASILLYMLAPEKMTGWPNPPTSEERPYIAPAVSRFACARPPHGPRRHGQPRGGAQNQARSDPGLRLGSRYLCLARRQRAGADQDPLHADRRALRGDARGACGCWAIFSGCKSAANGSRGMWRRPSPTSTRRWREVPRDQRPRVYLARGPDGLETGVVGSINTEIIERAGGLNVAEAAGPARAGARIDGAGDRRRSRDHPDLGPQFLRPRWQGPAVGWHPRRAGEARLSGADGALRLDRPAAVIQPGDRPEVAGGAVLSRQARPTTFAKPRATSIVCSIMWISATPSWKP